MTDRELMQRAMKGLEAAYEGQIWLSHLPDLIIALRERLAQPQRTHWEGCEEVHPECKEPQPVAHVYRFEPNGRPVIAWDDAKNIKMGDKLYKLEK